MTFDRGGRQKKGWKAFQANYDYVFSLSNRLCSYCLTDQQVATLLSMTEYLSWPTRWVSDLGDIDRDIITNFTDELERRLMSGCCDDNLPIQWRYSPDGVLQQSTNGGGVFVDAPLYDPRVYSVTFPPISGDDGNDKKCIAATGAAAILKQQVGDQLTDGMSHYTLSQLITDWVGTMIQSSNPFQALLTVVTNQIFALVIATLRPALTDTVYSLFKCILYCHMARDASFDTTKWQAVRDDITSLIGGIAGIFLEHLVYLLGEKGLTNLARAGGATTGDCSDCTGCVTCSPDDWRTGLYYSGSWHTPRGGTIIEIGADYVIIQSQMRSDDQAEIALAAANTTSICNISLSFVGTPPAHTLQFFGYTSADYATYTHNDLQPSPVECAGFYYQMDPGTWQLKVTFL